MNLVETNALLRYIAAFDNRRFDDATVIAWHSVLANIEPYEATEAVRRHITSGNTDYLAAAHICQRVKVIRDEQRRQRPHEIRALPSRFEPDPKRVQRTIEGAAQCRAEMGKLPSAQGAMDTEDPVRDRALRRARGEKRAALVGGDDIPKIWTAAPRRTS